MIEKKAITVWREVSDFFFRLEIDTELDFQEGKINRKEKNKLVAQIREDRRASLKANNPFLNANPHLAEMGNCFL